MNWFDWPFGKDPATQDAPQALIADVEKRGKQYLEDVDNGKWVYPACKRTSSDAGAMKLRSVTTRGWKPCAIC